jgi:hypothetical protein
MSAADDVADAVDPGSDVLVVPDALGTLLVSVGGNRGGLARRSVGGERLAFVGRLVVDFREDALLELPEHRGLVLGDIDVRTVRVDSPSPRAFGLATLLASDVVLAEDESAVLREFQQRVLSEIDDEAPDEGEPLTSD